MPTLAAFLTTSLASAGYTPADVTLVEWYGSAEWGWLPVDRDTFMATAAGVDVASIPEPNRERLRFTLTPPTPDGTIRTFAWDNAAAAFLLVPERPSIVSISAADLTT